MNYIHKPLLKASIIIAIIVILILLPYSVRAQDQPARFASGITINNGQPAGTMVYMKPISTKLWSASAINIAGTEGALFTQIFYTMIERPSWSLSLGVGPNAEIVNADRENDPIVTYLNACTGLSININPSSDIAFHAGVLYITPAHPVMPFKIFALLSFPLTR